MNCMKCGRECNADAVFCQDCLLEMEKYPVHPGTVVLLPRHREYTVIKKIPKRHTPTPEEQIGKLRKWVFILTLLLAIFIGLIAAMFKPTMHYVLDEHFEIGQNYSSVTITTTPNTASSTG